MSYTQQRETIKSLMEKATIALANFIFSGLQQNLEPIRLARPAYTLLSTGCSIKGSFPWENLAQYFVNTQHRDGGWNDVEETLWSLGYLAFWGDKYKNKQVTGIDWLASVRLSCSAWGESDRDQPRIPITALASALVPAVVDTAALEWLAKQWEADCASPTQLTYKGAFFLLSQAHEKAPAMNDLVDRTITYLCEEQNEDGGFGPWKKHPVGSDPWTTGVVLWGLSKFPQRVSKDVIDRAVKWLQTNQLPNGLWPYHYLDDGSSMALIGLSSVLPVLIES